MWKQFWERGGDEIREKNVQKYNEDMMVKTTNISHAIFKFYSILKKKILQH